jgi:UDP-glucuronate 4-epimerase
MSLFIFTRAILENKPIQIFNHGRVERDFTYIDDIVEAVMRLVDRIPAPDPNWSGDHPDSATSSAPYRIYNIGNHHPESVLRLVEILENCLGRKADAGFVTGQRRAYDELLFSPEVRKQT